MSQIYKSATGGGGGTPIVTINGDVGSISGSNVTIYAHQNPLENAGSTVQFLNSGTVSVLNFTDSFGNTMLGQASGNLSQSGSANTAVGFQSLNLLTTGVQNSAFGSNAMGAMQNGFSNTALGEEALLTCISGGNNVAVGHGALTFTLGSNNTACGTIALQGITGSNNSAFGYAALNFLTTGTQNTGIGEQTLNTVLTGSNNTALGYQAGFNYNAAESNNILIGANVGGTVGESNVTRLGGAQTQCYIAGVLNTNSGRVVNITAPGAYPYTTLITDDVIIVDTTSARTITPLGSPVKGTRYTIKDNTGSAAANNITITPSGKNIDGMVSYVINNNYGSATIVYNGTQWNLI